MRKSKKLTCVMAISQLMSDYQPRTSEMIADLTGFSHGRVRSELAKNFNFTKERRVARGGGIVAWHSLRKHNHKPKQELQHEPAKN